MGRYAEWVRYKAEWREIRIQRELPRHSNARSTLLTAVSPGRLLGLISSSLGISPKPGAYCDQTQSLLFRLPPEVREAIWTYVVGGHHVKIVRKMTKLGHAVMPRDQPRLDRAVRVSTSPGWIKLVGLEKRYKAHEVLAEESLLPLLQTCKRVYQEAVEALYAHYKFEFGTMEAFHRFLQLSPAAGLQHMSQLEISWPGFAYWPRYEIDDREPALEHNESWAEICSVIAAMGGLRELTLRGWRETLQSDRIRFPDLEDYDMMVKIIVPLRALSDRVNFQLIIRGDTASVQQYQDRLRGDGYTNVQLVRFRSKDLEP